MQVRCSYDELVPIAQLKANPKNPNTHSKDQIKRLAQIMKYQGIRNPVIVSQLSGYVVAGHGRLEAAELNGWDTFPVNYQEFTGPEQEYAALVSDNSIAEWSALDLSSINSEVPDLGPDFDIDLLGIEDFELEVADKVEPEADEDDAPRVPTESKTVLGDVYEFGGHKLVCGDCTDSDLVASLFGKSRAELCFTSPPYADQRDYNGGKELSTEYLATFMRAAYGKVAYFAVNLGYSRKNGEVNTYWDDYILEAKNTGLRLLSWNIWDRVYPASIAQQTAMFPVEHEWVFVFGDSCKELNNTVPNKGAGSRIRASTNRQKDGSMKEGRKREVSDSRPLGTIFQCDIHRGDSKHPAMFPARFAEGYIEAMTNPGDSVYEPFGGSGSTLIACEKTNRTCYMMELDPHYCDVIVQRWCDYTGRDKVKLNGEEITWAKE